MASTGFKFGMTSKEFFKVAKSSGLVCKKTTSGKRYVVDVSHPKLDVKRSFYTAIHGEAAGPLIQFASSCVKQAQQLEKLESATKKPQSQPDVVEETLNADDVNAAAETLVLWLDDRIKNHKMVNLFMAALNPSVRASAGLPESSVTMQAAIDRLIERGFLRPGKLPTSTGKVIKGYQIHPDLIAGDPMIVTAYANGVTFDPMPAQPSPTITPKPATAPATAPTPVPPASRSFADVLLERAKDSAKLVQSITDTYIREGQYEDLAQMIIDSGDVDAAVEILRRVATLAKNSV